LEITAECVEFIWFKYWGTVTFSHAKTHSYDIKIIFIRFIGTHQEYDNVTSTFELGTSGFELGTSGLKINSTRSESKRWS
jgi:hypothetical protein